jgi:hypothetical protein
MEKVAVLSCQVQYITVIWYIFGHLVHFLVIWYIFGHLVLWSFGILVAIWYLFPPFGILYQDKSGNPGVVVTT